MFYLAMFIICGVSPINDWIGDRDSGPTCVIAETATFPTLDQCEFRLQETLKAVRTYDEQKILAMRLKGPYRYDMSCKITIDKGFLDCVNCQNDRPTTK